MIIDSDFDDYYDAALRACADSRLPAGAVYTRRRVGPIARPRAFELLERLGWRTVRHGMVEEVCADLAARDHVIVYRDLYAHGVCGDGSDALVFTSRDEALRDWAGSYCSAYIMNEEWPRDVVTTSVVAVGSHRYTMYSHRVGPPGPDAWASNRGSWETHLHGKLRKIEYEPLMPYPVWSVDYLFVEDPGGKCQVPVAFDLNTAPILATTGLQHILKPETIVARIVDAWLHQQARRSPLCT